jgi:hypothetical protein
MAKQPTITAELVKVTPELASKWLKEKNLHNRPVTSSHVRFLASQMEKGEWSPTGQTIQFSDTDRLLDGQHRLYAIIESKKPQTILIVSGVPDSSQAVIDTGKTRSAGDVLKMSGVANHTITAAMIKNFMRFRADITSYGGDKKVYHTNSGVLEEFNKDKTLYAQTALYAQSLYKAGTGMLPASVIGGFYLLFLEKSTLGNHVPVKQFFDALITSKGREFESTVTILANKLTKARMSKTRISQRELFGMMVKAWNANIEGKYIQHLNMKQDEEIPKILIHPEATKPESENQEPVKKEVKKNRRRVVSVPQQLQLQQVTV